MTKCKNCKEEAAPGRTRCEKHLKQRLEEAKRAQARRMASGRCKLCGKPRDPSNATYCTRHMLKAREHARLSNQRRIAKRKAAGLCIRCTNPVAPGSASHCVEHLASVTADRKKVKLQVFEKLGGKCVRCGEANPSLLTMHHPNGDGWEHRQYHDGVGRLSSHETNLSVLNGTCQYEVQLLCVDCHKLAHKTSSKSTHLVV